MMRPLLLVALALGGCAGARELPISPQLQPLAQPLDRSLTKDCPDEPEIPAEADLVGLSEGGGGKLLGWYRVNYAWCRETKSATVKIIQERDAGIGAAK
jgi:hypothetical protein